MAVTAQTRGRVAGKLHVSVVEARDVVGDSLAEPSFYVRLKIGAGEATTKKSYESFCPKFMADFKFDVDDIKSSSLRLELLQVGLRGDLVVGSKEIPMSAIAGKGTIIKWISVHSSNKSTGADVCIVMKYSDPSKATKSKHAAHKASVFQLEPVKSVTNSLRENIWRKLPDTPQQWFAASLAMVSGLLVGAACVAKARRPVRKLPSLGGNCTISACVHEGYEEIFRRNLSLASHPLGK